MVSPHPYEDLPLLVLTGVGRSGTTALRKALSTHPAIISTGHEHNVAFDVLECARRNRTEGSRRFAMQTTDEVHDALFRRLIYDLVFPEPAPAREGQCVMLFTNLFPETATYLTEALTTTRVVCLVRNGVEVIASRMKHEHFGSDDFERHCHVWTNAAAMSDWCADRSDSIVIRYERLKADPVSVCDEIAHLMGIEPSAAPGAHLRQHTYHPTDHGGPAWASWTDAHRRTFETLCGEAMRQLGYDIPWLNNAAHAS